MLNVTNANFKPSAAHMNDLENLYQEVIVDHAKHPRGKGKPAHCRYCQEGKNPLCGDEITVFCEVDTSAKLPLITVSFEGSGCSISQASASMMCSYIRKKNACEARALISEAESIYTGKHKPQSQDDINSDVEALAGVSKFPVRVKCAALAWKSLDLLLIEHFDQEGNIKTNDLGCEVSSCNNSRKLKVISTETK